MKLNIEKMGKQNLENTVLASVIKNGDYQQMAPLAWQELHQHIHKANLINPKSQMMGLSFDNPTYIKPEYLRYIAALSIDPKGVVPAPLFRYVLEGGSYDVFRYTGAYDYLGEVYMSILRDNQFDFRDAPFIEIYRNTPETAQPEELITDIFIPVK